jgi:hypothetical protein
MRRRIIVMLLVLPGACAEPEEPIFTFRIVQLMTPEAPETTLLDMTFANYTSAKNAGPFTVDVADETTTRQLSFMVGYCERAASCAGPISLEHLGVLPQLPGYVGYFECVGIDGSESGGIDKSGTGDCAD